LDDSNRFSLNISHEAQSIHVSPALGQQLTALLDLAAAPFNGLPAPSAEDYLTDPLYPYEV
jgi:hypothetical protein